MIIPKYVSSSPWEGHQDGVRRVSDVLRKLPVTQEEGRSRNRSDKAQVTVYVWHLWKRGERTSDLLERASDYVVTMGKSTPFQQGNPDTRIAPQWIEVTKSNASLHYTMSRSCPVAQYAWIKCCGKFEDGSWQLSANASQRRFSGGRSEPCTSMVAAVHHLDAADTLMQVWVPALSWLPSNSSWAEIYQGTVIVINDSPLHGRFMQLMLNISLLHHSYFTLSTSTSLTALLAYLVVGLTFLSREVGNHNLLEPGFPCVTFQSHNWLQEFWGTPKWITLVPYIFLSAPFKSSPTSSCWTRLMVLFTWWPLF